MFRIVVVPGVSHNLFGDGKASAFVKQNDLRPEVSAEEAHTAIAAEIVHFILHEPQPAKEFTHEFFAPILESMRLEGSENFKPGCNQIELVNKFLVNCTHGAPWVEYAQQKLVPDSFTALAALRVDDNFHLVQKNGNFTSFTYF